MVCVCVIVGPSEDHSAVVPHIRLQASGDDASVPLHQPGAHQGLCVCGIMSRLFNLVIQSASVSPAYVPAADGLWCLCVSVCGGLSGGRV